MRISFVIRLLSVLSVAVAVTVAPTEEPTMAPTTTMPTMAPTTTMPTAAPSIAPTMAPTTTMPTAAPSIAPTMAPTTTMPTAAPSIAPTMAPTTTMPTAAPSMVPTTMMPTAAPSMVPTTTMPTVEPSQAPTTTKPTTIAPSVAPSVAPTVVPTTIMPTVEPTVAPTVKPTTMMPTVEPSVAPTAKPTTTMPSVEPSAAPSAVPTTTMPSVEPSAAPSMAPTTTAPSWSPSFSPSAAPSASPSWSPSWSPSVAPSVAPSVVPSVMPFEAPSAMPSPSSLAPSWSPSIVPTTHMPSVSSAPTLSGGWTSQKWFAGNKLLIVSGRRTDYCIPFYVNKEVAFNYMNHCGQLKFQEWIYAADDVNCEGEVQHVNEYSMETKQLEDGQHFGVRHFPDITSYQYTCTAGKADPLAQFSGSTTTHFAVRLNYPVWDEACLSPTTEVMSYVAFREDYCYQVHVAVEELEEGVDVAVMFHGETTALTAEFENGNFSFGTISQTVIAGHNCSAPDLMDYSLQPTDMCLHDEGYEYNQHGDVTHRAAVTSEASDKVLASVKKDLSRDFIQEAQNHRLYQTHLKLKEKKQNDKMHRRNKQVQEGENTESTNESNSVVYFGGSGSEEEYSSSSSSSTTYYAEYELFENWHEYGYKWTNAPRINVPTVPTLAPTQMAGWAAVKYMAGDDVVIESGRRTGVCIPVYNNQTVFARYVAVCGEGILDALVYYPEDEECTGPILTFANFYGGDYDDHVEGQTLEIGRRKYWDITTTELSCTAGRDDPLSSHFTSKYAVKVNYNLDDTECETGLTDLQSYVAFKDSFCFNLNLGEDLEYMNGSMSYTVDSHGDVLLGKYIGLDCETRVFHNTLTTDECMSKEEPLLISPAPSSDAKSKAIKENLGSNHVQNHFDQILFDAVVSTDYGKMMTKKSEQKKTAKKASQKNAVKSVEEESTHGESTSEESSFSDTSSYSYYFYYIDAKLQLYYGFTESSYEWMVFPRSTPVKVPTMAPTKSETYSFEVAQTLNGISKTDFESNEGNSLAFRNTVATTMGNGIEADDVEITDVIDSSTERKLRGLTTSSIEVLYTVTINLIGSEFEDIDTAFSTLKTALVDATSSGSFATTLNQYADTYGGSTALASVTAEEPTVSDPVQVNTGDDNTSNDDDKKGNDTALIIGLVVGLGGGLILIGVAAFCFMSRRGNKVASV